MAVRTIDAAELARVLSMEDAVEALENAFRTDRIPTSTKQRSGLKSGELLVMPSSDGQAAGVKVLTINPSNSDQDRPLIQGVYVLFSDVLEPTAIIDGAALTELRTAAVSGLATRFLARQDARRLVLFGAGAQAQAHLKAMCAVRPIEEVKIVGRTPARAARLAEQASAMGLKADVASADAVADANIVCTCTTATEPLSTVHYYPMEFTSTPSAHIGRTPQNWIVGRSAEGGWSSRRGKRYWRKLKTSWCYWRAVRSTLATSSPTSRSWYAARP